MWERCIVCTQIILMHLTVDDVELLHWFFCIFHWPNWLIYTVTGTLQAVVLLQFYSFRAYLGVVWCDFLSWYLTIWFVESVLQEWCCSNHAAVVLHSCVLLKHRGMFLPFTGKKAGACKSLKNSMAWSQGSSHWILPHTACVHFFTR